MAEIIPVEPFDYIVFGGTGDLARRKLLPALYHRYLDGQIPNGARIIGVSRSDLDTDAYRQDITNAVKEFLPASDIDDDALKGFLNVVFHVSLDAVNNGKDWDGLIDELAGRDDYVRVFYMATAPRLYGDVAQNLSSFGLITPLTRIVLEKPIGTDLASAKAINDAVGKVFDEKAIYRIDHYLGKETVQNLMALRFANALFEPLWSNNAVDHIQITVAETVGVGTRASYYDHSGAMRDMVQNHLLQLLCLTAMEPPSVFDAACVRDEKLKVLRALRPITAAEVDKKTVRGQYRKGAVEDQAVKSYLDEDGVADNSNTETFCVLKAEIDNWRWAGVPFYLRTGKRMAIRASEIVVSFKEVKHSIFSGNAGKLHANKLVIRLQPDEGISLDLMTKEPGPGGMRLKPAELNLSFAEAFDERNPEAYERLLMDVVRGNQTLFMHRKEVETAWEWVEPILTAWAETKQEAHGYMAGSLGPAASIALIERDGRTWDDDLL